MYPGMAGNMILQIHCSMYPNMSMYTVLQSEFVAPMYADMSVYMGNSRLGNIAHIRPDRKNPSSSLMSS